MSRDICTAAIQEDGSVEIMRGEIRKILRIFPQACIVSGKAPHLDIEYRNPDFKLDPYQVAAIEAIKKKRQGLIVAATSAGKSAIIMAAIAEKKTRTLILVNRATLAKQLADDGRAWLRVDGKEPKIVLLQGGLNVSERDMREADLFIGIDKTVKKLIDKDALPGLGMVIVDEVHQAAAPTFQGIVSCIDAPYRFGLTGTLKRKDQMEFLVYAAFGEIIATISEEALLEMDRVTKVVPVLHATDATIPDDILDLPSAKKLQAINESLHNNGTRNALIRKIIGDIFDENPKAKIIVLSRFVKPCYRLQERLNFFATTLTGQEPRAAQIQACQDLKDGKVRLMFATIGCVSTGISISDLTDVVLISPCHSNELLVKQIKGRLMRKSEDKIEGRLHYLWDNLVFDHRCLKRFVRYVEKIS